MRAAAAILAALLLAGAAAASSVPFLEAGGRFGDWSGRETIHGGEALSTSERLWPQVAALVGEREASPGG